MGGVSKIPADKLERIAEIWSAIQSAGGGLKELGTELGCTDTRAWQLVKKYNLPKARSFKERYAIFLEELEFLYAAGEGVYAISRALGMAPESLAEKVDKLHYAGKTTVIFTGWRQRYATEPQKEAA